VELSAALVVVGGGAGPEYVVLDLTVLLRHL
jgi:hypothetical protein